MWRTSSNVKQLFQIQSQNFISNINEHHIQNPNLDVSQEKSFNETEIIQKSILKGSPYFKIFFLNLKETSLPKRRNPRRYSKTSIRPIRSQNSKI